VCQGDNTSNVLTVSKVTTTSKATTTLGEKQKKTQKDNKVVAMSQRWITQK